MRHFSFFQIGELCMKPSLIVVAGPNGAGKTTITEKLLRHEWMDGCTYINPDIIAQEKFGGWNSQEAIIKAVAMADRSYFYDNSINNIDPIQLFRTVNGKIVKFYNELPPWAKDVSEQLAGE